MYCYGNNLKILNFKKEYCRDCETVKCLFFSKKVDKYLEPKTCVNPK